MFRFKRSPDAKPKRSFARRWLRRGLLAGGSLLLLFLIAFAAWSFWQCSVGREELARALADTDARDPNWRRADLLAEWDRRPPDGDAMVWIRACAGAATPHPYIGPFRFDEQIVGCFSQREVELLRSRRPEVEKALKHLEGLDARSVGHADATSSDPDFLLKPPPDLVAGIRVIHLLKEDFEWRLEEGKIDLAILDLERIVAVSRTMKDVPRGRYQRGRYLAAEELATRVQRLLGRVECSDALLAAVTRLLEECRDDGTLVGLRAYRAEVHQLFDEVAAGSRDYLELTVVGNTNQPEDFRRRLAGFAVRVADWSQRERQEAAVLSSLNQAVELAKARPVDEAAMRSWFIASRNGLYNRGWGPFQQVYFGAMVDQVHLVGDAFHAKQLLQTTIALVAVERYRLANNRLPAGLDELVPKFLAAVEKDTRRGMPMYYEIINGIAVVGMIERHPWNGGGLHLYPPAERTLRP